MVTQPGQLILIHSSFEITHANQKPSALLRRRPNRKLTPKPSSQPKTGQIKFSHPKGTPDDQLLALALAVYATRTPDTSYMGVGYGVPKNY